MKYNGGIKYVKNILVRQLGFQTTQLLSWKDNEIELNFPCLTITRQDNQGLVEVSSTLALEILTMKRALVIDELNYFSEDNFKKLYSVTFYTKAAIYLLFLSGFLSQECFGIFFDHLALLIERLEKIKKESGEGRLTLETVFLNNVVAVKEALLAEGAGGNQVGLMFELQFLEDIKVFIRGNYEDNQLIRGIIEKVLATFDLENMFSEYLEGHGLLVRAPSEGQQD